jgi:hypothetical protein
MNNLAKYKLTLDRSKRGRKRAKKNLPFGKRQVEGGGVSGAIDRLQRVSRGRARKNATSAGAGVAG